MQIKFDFLFLTISFHEMKREMDIRDHYKKILGADVEQRVFEFCYKESTAKNYPLDWLAPCGFKQYYTVKCEEVFFNITKWPELAENPKIMYLSNIAKNPGFAIYDTKATFTAKVYSKDHTCGRCGLKKITITKKQTRSADEGHTVIFACDACGWSRREN
jgi:DNA-directed RNA polymerase subunit M/transcription elongation factor TFIIS